MSIRSGRSTGSGQTDETSKHQALDSALYRRRRRPGQAEIVGGGDGNGVESPEEIRANDKEVSSRSCGRSNRRRSSVVAMIQLSSVLLVLGVALAARYQRTIHHMQHEQELLVQQQQPHSAIPGGVATTTVASRQSNATTKFSSSVSSSSMSSPACRQKDVPITNHTIRLYERPCQPIPVAYAISLIKCGNYQSTPEGLVDAALVLHHSVHQQFRSSSRMHQYYDYKMYALVHPQAVPCSSLLQEAGFTVVVQSPPLEKSDIRGDFLRQTIHKEVCCGHDEFIKLYAYTLPEPIVVHVDLDFIFHQPMMHVLDALLYHKDSAIGQEARRQIERERPTDPWPDEPQAFWTRDWPQVYPGRVAAYQAGFMVLRPNPQVLHDMVELVKEGHYVAGHGRDNGWGGKGYGGFVGAKAMQGLVAYYYDQFAPDTWVELNQCRFNHMGIDTKFRPGGFGYKGSEHGKCRNRQDTCEDCQSTNTSQIYSIHFTKCRKPWNCIGQGDSSIPHEASADVKKALRKTLIPEQLIPLPHCLDLLQIWHSVRSDLEHQLHHLIQQTPSSIHVDTTNHNNNDNNNMGKNQTFALDHARRGSYRPSYFQGHCLANGKYLALANGDKETLQRIPELYRKPKPV